MTLLPFAVSAQERVRRVGVLLNASPEDAEGQAYVAALQQGMQERGWNIGRDLLIDLRWGGNDGERWQRQAAELVALPSDVIVAAGATAFTVQRISRTVPIVFVQAIDPVGTGLAASLARPGSNATGFTQFDYSLAGKWFELLREIAPAIRRIAVLRDPRAPAGIGQWAMVQGAAATAAIEVIPIDTHAPDTIERGVADFASEPNGGLIAAVGSSTVLHRDVIIAAAARHRLPAVYPYRYFAAAGGLISYGPRLLDNYRRAAEYVDRILKGAKPADLPVQAPTRYELAINLKTAKASGFAISPTLLARADEAIE